MRTGRLLLGVCLVASLLVVAAPAAEPFAIRVLENAAARTVRGGMSYDETNPGKAAGGATLGVAGRGTFSAKLRLPAVVVGRIVQIVTDVPIDAMAKGGSYVTRYDIDAKGNYHGVVVATFKSSGLGSICLKYTVTHGKFDSKLHFFPTTGTFATVGGTGQSARVRLAGTVKMSNVTGADVEQFLGSSGLKATSGAAKAPSAACVAATKLAP
jgi:hypothetical protein